MNDESNISYYITKAKSISPSVGDKKFKVGLVSSFTINGLEEIIRVKCSESNIFCRTYVSGYNQYVQEILNPQSDLYDFSPDLTFLILDTRTILGDIFYFPYSLTADEKHTFVNKKIKELIELMDFFFYFFIYKLIFFIF